MGEIVRKLTERGRDDSEGRKKKKEMRLLSGKGFYLLALLLSSIKYLFVIFKISGR